MASIARLRVEWSGTGIQGTGLSTFYFNPSNTGAATAVKAFFTALNPVLWPAGLTITVPPGGDIIDDATGVLSGAWTDAGTGGTITGTGSGTYSLGVGMRVKWGTNGIFRGRRVQGSTFIVPIMGAIFDSNGTIANATVTSSSAAAQTLATSAPQFKVWSRPGPTWSGTSNNMTSGTVPDKVSWLRTRRT